MNVHGEHDVSRVPAHLFTKMSERLRLKQVRRDLTFAQWGLATWLTCNADRRTDPPSWTGKLGTLVEQTGWRYSEQQLRTDLAVLRSQEWIDYTMRQRSRKPYVIVLTGLFVSAAPGTDSKVTANKKAPPTLHREGARLQSVGSASLHEERPDGRARRDG